VSLRPLARPRLSSTNPATSEYRGAPGKRADKVRGSLAAYDESVQKVAVVRRALAVESESLLDQAAGFARGGDYLGAQARARFAEQRFIQVSAALPTHDPFVVATHAHLDLRIRHYDSLVRERQMEVEARHAVYVARERRAIGADPSPPTDTS
jgi:hypothetical protein